MNSQLNVTLIQYMGNDQIIANAARVSTDTDNQGKPIEGLIRYLGRERHTSPFEHNAVTFMVEAPLFVRDQWVRHRTQSYNCLSLRYSTLAKDVDTNTLFYIPPPERPLVNEGSGAHPKFVTEPSLTEYEDMATTMFESNLQSYQSYLTLIESGVAEEVARNVLPVNTMTRFYATANVRNWERFVSERTAPNAQWEIKQLALKVDHILEELYPIGWSSLKNVQD